MRRIIKGRQIVTDHWRHLADDEPLPEGPVSVSLARWQAEREALLSRFDRVGLRLKNDDDLKEIVGDLSHFALIALEFPVFKDGRAFSQARLLRERYGYRGELRAIGDVLRDQLFFMQRVGIDAYELRADRDLEDALEAFAEFTVTYQPAVDEPLPLYRRR